MDGQLDLQRVEFNCTRSTKQKQAVCWSLFMVVRKLCVVVVVHRWMLLVVFFFLNTHPGLLRHNNFLCPILRFQKRNDAFILRNKFALLH